jgi:sarcosine oxidase
MPARFDVIVAGLGAMGSAAAWTLARRGFRVAGFDRFRPPHAHGSSTGRSRIIREAYWESPFYVPLVRRAYEQWTELEARTGRRIFRPTGGLVIGPEDGPLVAGALRSAQAHGVPCERLTAAMVRGRYPFQPTDDLVGVLEPRAGVLRPEEAITAMLGEAAAHGATLMLDQAVESWHPGAEGLEVRTPDETYLADRLVLAAGAWMPALLAGVRAPLSVARQVMFWVQPSDPARFQSAVCPVWLWETRAGPVYYGFPDLGEGPKIARHHGGEVTTADTVRREVEAGEEAGLLAFLESAIPALHGPVRDARVCLYTNTPDEHFIVDRHPADPRVVLVSACSGHGFKFAPALGEVAADLVADRAPRFDLTPFRLDRFQAGPGAPTFPREDARDVRQNGWNTDGRDARR